MRCTLFLFSLAVTVAGAAPVFKATVVDDKITIGYGLAIADMDGDKKPDILLADAKEIVWYKNPGWEKSVIAKNLTARDNVCIAARDLDGDGKAEVAVGAQWNPGETNNEKESGAVFYLQRPEKEGELWKPVELPHEPTVHRMHWVRTGPKQYALVVLPLHGRGNVNNAGPNGSKAMAYAVPEKRGEAGEWKVSVLDDSMHVTHNFDLRPKGEADELLIGGKEALLSAVPNGAGWDKVKLPQSEMETGGSGPEFVGPVFGGAGEVRFGPWVDTITCIEPFHGANLTLFRKDDKTRTWQRRVLDTSFKEGHALACEDVLGLGEGKGQIVAGWRMPDAAKQTGIRIYHEKGGEWKRDWVCAPNSMACEDLKVADLDGDGKPEIIAAGRATKNVVVYKLEARQE